MNKGYRAVLAGLALLIGTFAIFREDWIAAAYWIAVEVYWGVAITGGWEDEA